jgi:hypothetical protein
MSEIGSSDRNWHPNAHGQGMYVLSFFDSAGEVSPVFERKARDIFDDYGLEDVEPDKLYSYDKIAPAFEAVVENAGEKTMFSGGKQMGIDIPWPDDVADVHDALAALDAIHQQATGAPDEPVDRPAGGYTYERVGPREARVGVTERYPNPESMVRGVYTGIVDSFSDDAYVELTETTPNSDERAAWTLSW